MKIGIVNDVAAGRGGAAARHRARRHARDRLGGRRWRARPYACAATQTPDLILMDLIMPVMDGVEATRRIMAAHAVRDPRGDHRRRRATPASVFDAMGHGALDAVDTPTLAERGSAARRRPLLRKIRNIGRLLGCAAPSHRAAAAATPAPSQRARCVAIGASAGGPAALATLLGALPADFRAGDGRGAAVDDGVRAPAWPTGSTPSARCRWASRARASGRDPGTCCSAARQRSSAA